MLERSSLVLILVCLACACDAPPADLEADSAPAGSIPRLAAATDDRLAHLDLLDVASHRAQLDHHLARIRGDDSKARDAYLRAENDLNQSLVSTWAAMPTIDVGGSYVVDAPMMLAMLDYQIELRRFLGPNFHTRVEGLRHDPGCAGDLIQDRLVWRFGAAAQAIHPLAGPDHPTMEPLNRWAHQVVCISDAQLAQLDYAMDLAFESVTGRMRHRGLERMIAPMARLVAPLTLLVLDARKHRGEHSRSWHWFDRHRPLLRITLGSAGWVGGDVMVWDRRHGVLVGFGPCASSAPGVSGASCVDLGVLLDSLADPRSLGLGQCGLSSMISGGTTHLPSTAPVGASPMHSLSGGSRYTCPATTCQSASTMSSPVPQPTTPEQRRRLSEIWPALSANSAQVASNLCIPGATDTQGTNFSLQSCLDSEFDSLLREQNNPFDAFLSCTMTAIGASPSQLPDVGTPTGLSGVPMGDQTSCGELSAGGARTSTHAPPIGSQPRPKLDKIATAHDAKGKPTAFTYVFTASDGTVYSVSSSAAGLVRVVRQPTPLDPTTTQVVPVATAGNDDQVTGETAAVGVIREQVGQERPDDYDTAHRMTQLAMFEDPTADWVVISGNGVDRYYGERSNGGQACFDALSCRDDCTALGRLLSETDACTEGMMDAMAAAVGRPRRDVTPGRERVSYPRPAGFEVEEHNFGGCFGPSRSQSPSICGLVMCATGLAEPTTAGCACRGPGGPALTRTSLCQRIRCADGNLPDPATCACDVPPGTPPAPQGPLPAEWPSSPAPMTLDACASGEPAIYDYARDPRSIVGRDGVSMWDR